MSAILLPENRLIQLAAYFVKSNDNDMNSRFAEAYFPHAADLALRQGYVLVKVAQLLVRGHENNAQIIEILQSSFPPSQGNQALNLARQLMPYVLQKERGGE